MGENILLTDKTLSVTEGASMRPYMLSELTVAELRKKLKVSRRWALLLLLVAGCAGAAVIGFTLRRVFETSKQKVSFEIKRSRLILWLFIFNEKSIL